MSLLVPKLLEKMRVYLSIVRSLDYNLTEEVQKVFNVRFN